MRVRIKQSVSRLRTFLNNEIWDSPLSPNEGTLRGAFIGLLRILTLSIKGLHENKLFSRAAALSYASLMGLGPLIAIVALISSSFIQADPEIQIKKALLFIAPTLQEYIDLSNDKVDSDDPMANALDGLISQIISGGEAILSNVNTAGSAVFGLVGLSILLIVVIQLLTTVETTLNQIWGIQKGRKWSDRIVFYWTFVSLGAIVGFGSTALFSVSNLIGAFNWVPFQQDIAPLLIALTPLFSGLLLACLLCFFYMFFPNTKVHFQAAIIGGFFTMILLFANNYFSILYVQRMISIQSLYGSVGIIPVMMFGLYVFWVVILLGGQITYAVQNVQFLSRRALWGGMSQITREILALAVFIRIARKFEDGQAAPTTEEIGNALHVPWDAINQSIEILINVEWITVVQAGNDDQIDRSTCFAPTRPLHRFTFAQFLSVMHHYGNSAGLNAILPTDPLLDKYLLAQQGLGGREWLDTNLEKLFRENPEPT